MQSAPLFKTPPIPASFATIAAKGYRNIYSFDLNQPNLFGTETLCGDWDGSVLILAKDFASTGHVSRRGKYEHDPTSRTNRTIVHHLTTAGYNVDISGRNNTECGILYMSACFLLKERPAGRSTGSISEDALRVSLPVLDFTICKMKRRLTDIIALGDVAHRILDMRFGMPGTWKQLVESGVPTVREGIRLHTLPHPAIRGPALKDLRFAPTELWSGALAWCTNSSRAVPPASRRAETLS